MYTTTSSHVGTKLPICSIGVGKSLLKKTEKDRKTLFYLEKDQEFEIYLFNPLQKTIACSVEFNGKKISDKLLVLNPGEKIWLDRYLDQARKFKFSTYNVDANDKDVDKAIQNNGLISISFFEEKSFHPLNNSKKSFDVLYEDYIKRKGLEKTIKEIHYIPQYPYHYYTYPNYNLVTSGTGYIGGASTLTNIDLKRTTGQNAVYSPGNTVYSSNVPVTDNLLSTNFDSNSILRSSSASKPNIETYKETGTIEKGSTSTTTFQQVDTEFETFIFCRFTIQLLPKSTFSKEDLKVFCTSCGIKQRNDKWKFCPSCGTQYN